MFPSSILWRSYLLFMLVLAVGVFAQHEWQARDAFDEIKRQFDKVNADNCPIQHHSDLFMPMDAVSHKPDIKEVNVNPVFPNRTALLHLQNMALSRSFFWSYILQSRFIRPAINDTYDPGMMYYFLSTVADVSANPHINASAVYFSPNSSYSSSYRGFFNKTFPRFGPRTFRLDDFNDPIHLQKISTWNTFDVQDLGAHHPDSISKDYTHDLSVVTYHEDSSGQKMMRVDFWRSLGEPIRMIFPIIKREAGRIEEVIVRETVRAAEDVGRETARAAQDTERETRRAEKDAERETSRAAHDGERETRRAVQDVGRESKRAIKKIGKKLRF